MWTCSPWYFDAPKIKYKVTLRDKSQFCVHCKVVGTSVCYGHIFSSWNEKSSWSMNRLHRLTFYLKSLSPYDNCLFGRCCLWTMVVWSEWRPPVCTSCRTRCVTSPSRPWRCTWAGWNPRTRTSPGPSRYVATCPLEWWPPFCGEAVRGSYISPFDSCFDFVKITHGQNLRCAIYSVLFCFETIAIFNL